MGVAIFDLLVIDLYVTDKHKWFFKVKPAIVIKLFDIDSFYALLLSDLVRRIKV